MLFGEYYHIDIMNYLPKNIDCMVEQHESIVKAKMELNPNLVHLEGVND
jgi:hypothetical protein